jgi:hypothetical protein
LLRKTAFPACCASVKKVFCCAKRFFGFSLSKEKKAADSTQGAALPKNRQILRVFRADLRACRRANAAATVWRQHAICNFMHKMLFLTHFRQ